MKKLFPLVGAYTALRKNRKYFAYAVILEFFFLIAVAQVHLFFFLPTTVAASSAAEIITQEVSQLSPNEVPDVDSILTGNPEFVAAYNSLLKNILLLLFSMLVVWIVFKGPAWFFGLKSVYKKMAFWRYMRNFALLSLFWFVILLAFLFFVILALNYAGASIMPLFGETITTYFLWFLFIIIAYFAQVSFALSQTFKKSFIIGVKQAKRLVPVFILNAVLVVAGFALALFTGKVSVIAVLPVVVFITIPLIIFARLHLIVAVWKCLRKH